MFARLSASLLYTALAVQGHCCTKHNIYSFDSCVHHTTELNPGSASERNLQQSLIDEVEEDFGLADAASGIARPKDVSIKCICPKRSGKCMLSAAFLLIYSAVTFFQLLVFLVGLWQWQMKTGLRHTNGGDDSPPCGDPLVGNYAPCALPFPSDYLLEPDPPSATRYRVAMTSKSIPLSRWDGELSPAAWNAQDGFSTVSPVLFAFAPKDKVPIDASCLISHANIEKSMDATKPAMTTILLDADSGELVPHWVDMDQYHLNYGDDMAADGRPPLLILQPAKPLRHNTTYIVGVRGLTAKGVAVPAEAAFKAVRDCVPPQCDPSAQLANGNPAIQWPKERTCVHKRRHFLCCALSAQKHCAALFCTQTHVQLAGFSEARDEWLQPLRFAAGVVVQDRVLRVVAWRRKAHPRSVASISASVWPAVAFGAKRDRASG